MTVISLKARLDALEAHIRPLDFDHVAEWYSRGADWRSDIDELEAEHRRREGRDLLPEEREWLDAFAARVGELRAEFETTLPKRQAGPTPA